MSFIYHSGYDSAHMLVIAHYILHVLLDSIWMDLCYEFFNLLKDRSLYNQEKGHFVIN